LPAALPVLRARLDAGPDAAALRGRRVLAFAGIAMPEKFFASLRDAGAEIVRGVPFPDHHMFRADELTAVLSQAETMQAVPVTTTKDAVRLPAEIRSRVSVLRVNLAWEDATAPERLLGDVINGWAAESRYRRTYGCGGGNDKQTSA
jgi:tetraacyldisaccharide 4'-kinase